jgi:hypothetical protein
VPRFPISALVLAAAVLSFVFAVPLAAQAKDGDGDGQVRVAGVCGNSVTSELSVKRDNDGLELRFKLRQGRSGAAWRVVLVQERRIAWKGNPRTTGSSGSFEVRRTLPDLPGADAITVRAWGPLGVGCRATATLRESSGA